MTTVTGTAPGTIKSDALFIARDVMACTVAGARWSLASYSYFVVVRLIMAVVMMANDAFDASGEDISFV